MKKGIASLVCASVLISAFGLLAVPAFGLHGQSSGPITESANMLFGISSSNSLNWAGYAVTGASGSVTNVTGSFVVPDPPAIAGSSSAVSSTMAAGHAIAYHPGKGGSGGGGSSKTSYAAFWAGIDGYNSNTVEQAGVLMNDSNGVVSYSVWYEFYPAAPVYAGWHPNAGDTVAVYVNYSTSGGAFVATVMDLTIGKTYVSPATGVSGAQRSSAEWIAEAPSSGHSILPLADFVTVYFGTDYTGFGQSNFATVEGTYASIGALSASSSVYSINMVSRNGSLNASTSQLSTDGTSFSVTWESS